MFICTQIGALVNLDRMECVQADWNRVLCGIGDKKIFVGMYKTEETAKNELVNIKNAILEGRKVYEVTQEVD